MSFWHFWVVVFFLKLPLRDLFLVGSLEMIDSNQNRCSEAETNFFIIIIFRIFWLWIPHTFLTLFTIFLIVPQKWVKTQFYLMMKVTAIGRKEVIYYLAFILEVRIVKEEIWGTVQQWEKNHSKALHNCVFTVDFF